MATRHEEGYDEALIELGYLTNKLQMAELNVREAVQHLTQLMGLVQTPHEQWSQQDRQVVQEARKFLLSLSEPNQKEGS